jgi:integrase
MRKRKPYILYQRGSGGDEGRTWYAAFWSAEEGKYIKRTSCKTTDEEQACKVAEDIIKKGIVPSDEDPPIAIFLKSFWLPDSFYARTKALRRRELSPRYIELSASAVRLYIEKYPPFKKTRISETTPGLFEKWMLWMQDQGKGPRTINIALQAAHVGIRRWAKLRQLADPLEGIQKAAEDHNPRGSFSLKEIQALMACNEFADKAGKKHEIDPRVRLSLLAGLRMGECRGLDWGDVDGERVGS